MTEDRTSARRQAADAERPTRDSGALYVHLQSEKGDHRTIVVSPRSVRILRTLWSWWGGALALAVVGSWVYFAIESSRVPPLTRRVAELEAEGIRIDTLQAKLQALQHQYDQVQRMLGAIPADSTSGGARGVSPPRKP